MRSLNVNTMKDGYNRLLSTPEGGRIAFEQAELARLFSDPAFVDSFPEGSLGAAYAAFLRRTGYSAEGLATVSRTDDLSREAPHPYAWFGRRMRDTHDVWHVLTQYRADDPLGEVCLTAFSFAQTKGLGWALIAVTGAIRALRVPNGWQGVKAIWQGYQIGRRAKWIHGEDYLKLFAEPLDAVRQRLNIGVPDRYLALRG